MEEVKINYDSLGELTNQIPQIISKLSGLTITNNVLISRGDMANTFQETIDALNTLNSATIRLMQNTKNSLEKCGIVFQKTEENLINMYNNQLGSKNDA